MSSLCYIPCASKTYQILSLCFSSNPYISFTEFLLTLGPTHVHLHPPPTASHTLTHLHVPTLLPTHSHTSSPPLPSPHLLCLLHGSLYSVFSSSLHSSSENSDLVFKGDHILSFGCLDPDSTAGREGITMCTYTM